MTKIELADWRGVLVVSGDGLINEVYNGLFARSASLLKGQSHEDSTFFLRPF
jgi:hypothetical protein